MLPRLRYMPPTIAALTLHSSVVLWVSQNMEDDYTYNLAL